MDRALLFRSKYGSGDTSASNGSPYFIGVWDTVATLGAGTIGVFGLGLLYLLFASAAAFGLKLMISTIPFAEFLNLSYLVYFFALAVGVPLATYILASLKFRQLISLKKYRMAFYNTRLDPAVSYARHAISIDENRKDFSRVQWPVEAADNALITKRKGDGPERFVQIWFAGNHSDIGGSYPENESRLSDITLAWMTNEATSLPHPIFVDPSVLNLYPSSLGPQHDERQSFIDRQPAWFVKLALKFMPLSKFGWPEGLREPPNDAPIHPSVVERFAHPNVLIYGDTRPYRPEKLRHHKSVSHFYS